MGSEEMEHWRADDVVWSEAPVENFTGRVRFGRLCDRGRVNALAVRFEVAARTDWHSHPEGQVLYVVVGKGRIQDEGGTTVEFGAGDTLYTPPGQVHWHGAGPDGPMIHLSLTTGGDTVWEPRKVTDEQYNRTTPIQISRYQDVLLPVLQALNILGGSGQLKEIVEIVGRLLNITDEQWMLTTEEGLPKIFTYIRRAASHLKEIGCITKPSIGRAWSLTDRGKGYLRRSQEETQSTLNDELSNLNPKIRQARRIK